MAKAADSPKIGFRPNARVFPADYEQIRLAFRALLNRGRCLNENPARILERLLDERVTIGGEMKTKREVIVAKLIEFASSGDRAASKLLDKFLADQRALRGEEQYAALITNKEVLQHIVEKLRGN